MKSKFVWIIAMTVVVLSLTAFMNIPEGKTVPVPAGQEFVIPEDVSAIFDKSCFGCHNSNSDSEKARKKLLIDQMSSLSAAKLVGKLGDISNTIRENEMPPEKFLAKYPDKKLTDEESKRLVEWADQTAEALLK